MLKAKWIWAAPGDHPAYNQTVVARKTFSLDEVHSAVLSITADSAYRLYINGSWVGDGPARAWPEHYQYDRIDVRSYLREGENEIRVIAKFWGTGTFHQVPQRPGLLVQLDVNAGSDNPSTIMSDASWQVAESRAWVWNTPKVSIQMAPQELYDARLADDASFEPATVIFEAGAGPWADLHPRDLPMLTKTPVTFRAFREANVVRHRRDLHLCIPTARLAHPGLIEANRNVIQAGGVATLVKLEAETTLRLDVDGMKVYIDGELSEDHTYTLAAGEHLLLAFVSEAVGHQKEKTLRVIDPPASMALVNPLGEDGDNPWCWIAFPDHAYAEDDLRWPRHGHTETLDERLQAYFDTIEELGASVADAATFRTTLSERAKRMPADQMFVRDTHWRFLAREPLPPETKVKGERLVGNPGGLIYDNPEVTVVHPSAAGDVELVYDLGKQVVGYYDLELIAEAGVEIDIYGVEYIAPDGRIQHTRGNRNGLRYITRAGVNRFTSTKRRSGRYLFITLRNQTEPVTIRKLRLIDATYPINAIGDFRCSDERLTRIWEISARTLKLCMEDTFTDCPLYEQTLWIGDARNESVFAYPVFDATDIGARCIKLAGQSLERYPIVGCQVPSSWDVLLPAWSFLWGISVWDYYAYTGDTTFLADVWPWVKRNLEGAADLRDPETGLFKGPFWNMFDWSGIDDNHEIVLHNSMLFVGAIDAAQRCAAVLDDHQARAWLDGLRRSLCADINSLWDPEKRAYPDSIHADGSVSDSTSQHTSFLALLYDIIPEEHAEDALDNVLTPPEGMVRVGSPFAIMYYYEALEKAGEFDAIINSIYEAYLPMLEAGATTVWEVFPTSGSRPGGFPTRSHAHAWSSAPAYFLNRIVLGVRPTAPGGAAFEISPRLEGLTWAEGTVATTRGPLHVAWRADQETLHVDVATPQGMQVRFSGNETHEGRTVVFEITPG